MRKLRFSMRTLLLFFLVVAVVLGSFLGVKSYFLSSMGYGPLRDPENWPRALHALIGDKRELRGDVKVYELGGWMDDLSIWLVDGKSPVIDELFAKHTFEPATASHPMAEELLSSIPYGWPKPSESGCTWLATPGFGSRHIEGVDLFLVVHDEKREVTIVLHYWIF